MRARGFAHEGVPQPGHPCAEDAPALKESEEPSHGSGEKTG